MDSQISKKDFLKIQSIIAKIDSQLAKINQIIENNIDNQSEKKQDKDKQNDKCIEGKFDGRFMKSDDGEIYLVAENYASKSKLVSGDRLKLTISPEGKYIFKQIEAIGRVRKIGKLIATGENNKVEVDGKIYNVLKASVTYYKLTNKSKVLVMLPLGFETNWATIENKVI